MLITQSIPDKSHRIEIIDVIRGVTLLGIIMVHMVEQYYAGMPPKEIAESSTGHLGDQIIMGFVSIFIIGKFYMLFSFLFGLSFYIQLSKKSDDGRFIFRFGWRLIILFIIGFIHHLHYRGDILTIYALLGFGLILFHRLPDRYLLLAGILFVVNVPAAIQRAWQLFVPDATGMDFNENDPELMQYYTTFKSGSYLELLKANFHSFAAKMDFQVLSGRIYITFGLFLLGYYTGRRKVFEELGSYLTMIKKGIRFALWTILGVILLGGSIFGGLALLKISLPDQANWMVGGLLFDVFNASLSFLYIGWIILLFQKEKWQRRLMQFYASGRMGLTTYLMQTVFGVLIFSNIGFGLINEIGATISFLLAIAFFIFQIWFSKVWFSRFEYGLFEWIWRTLTHLKPAPFLQSRKN